jgi:hypothetical protein
VVAGRGFIDTRRQQHRARKKAKRIRTVMLEVRRQLGEQAAPHDKALEPTDKPRSGLSVG